MFTNKINNKKYIGSAIDLNKCISRCFQKSCLNNNIYKNYYIIRALKKYGIPNLIISVLEYTNIDILKPEYNI